MDAAQEHRVRVLEAIPRGPRAVSARFERPEGFSYMPGQWVFVAIERDGEMLTRHLTLSSSPTEPFLEVTKGMTGHPFAEAVAALAPGDEVRIKGPHGRFTIQEGDEDAVFVTGGIGVTPLRSMVRFAAESTLLFRVLLLYSARTEDDLLFLDEFEELQRANPLFTLRTTLTRPEPGWAGRTGRIDRAFLEREVEDVRGRAFYTSGPAAMVDEMVRLFGEMGVPGEMVRREVFTGY
jgi:ferredoxin-NADP reductase